MTNEANQIDTGDWEDLERMRAHILLQGKAGSPKVYDEFASDPGETPPSFAGWRAARSPSVQIDTGDAVLHRPSGETWLVAYVRNGYVCCCGWPESLAKVEDCELTRKATPEKRMELLEKMKTTEGSRGAYARQRLAEEKPDGR